MTSWLRAVGVSTDFADYYYFLGSLGRKTRWVATRLLRLVLRNSATAALHRGTIPNAVLTHANRRHALRRHILRNKLSLVQQACRVSHKTIQLIHNLMKLAA